MPREVRRLVFTNTESAAALRSFAPRFHINFPAGTLLHSRFSDDTHTLKPAPVSDGLRYQASPKTTRSTLIVTFFDGKEHVHSTLTQDFVIGALVQYCLEHKIMMPKGSARSISVVDLHLCLDLEMVSGEDGAGASPLSLEDS